jgi:2-iminobutanoate/2-iminopropanoate deaminase
MNRPTLRAPAAACLIACVACTSAPSAPPAASSDRTVAVEYFPRPGGKGDGLPFSESVQVGDMLYLSGQLGTDSTGTLVPGGIQPETRQALENIRAALARRGATLDDVVKCTAMLRDMAEWGSMNQVYVTFFTKHLPARSAFGTTGLALNARMELECFAYVGKRATP